MFEGRDWVGATLVGLLAIAGGTYYASAADDSIAGALREHTTHRAQAALTTAEAGPGEALTIVRETRSKKYAFLNKQSYEVHTASVARARTVLRASESDDQRRATRHAEVRRRGTAIVGRVAGGWRVTVPDPNGLRTAEVTKTRFAIGAIDGDQRAPGRPFVALLLGLVFIVLGLSMRAPIPGRGRALLGPQQAWVLASALFSAALLGLAYATLAVDVPEYVAPLFSSRQPQPDLSIGRPIGLLLALSLLFVAAVFVACGDRGAQLLAALRRDREAYTAIAPAMLGLVVLVGFPFAVGMGLSLFSHHHGDFTFVGLANFGDIMSAEGDWFAPRTLPYSLAMTVVWTGLNVVLHLGIGLGLALILKRHASKYTRLYRVILIVPWAVPSYLTALIWRSMFDADVGVINRVLGLEGMSWMHDTFTAFIANLATNVWLGVPFMMVVCLGALTSIPSDLYEAAEVDGASRFEQLRLITIPLLKPALLPSVILGSIWTFNKFEVIYLVSEGRPDGATDILVTESYRWAFERGLAQGGAYGYAAAYSVIIFAVLLLYGWMTARVSAAAEEALR